MSLKLNSVGGGSVTLQEPNTASNFTLDLPAASGTISLSSYAGGSVVGFASSGTFTVPAGITQCYVQMIGGGAGGSSDGNVYGGRGGYALARVTGLTPGASITVTVGAGGASDGNGGTSSFGAFITCTGGTRVGGGNDPASGTTSFGAGVTGISFDTSSVSFNAGGDGITNFTKGTQSLTSAAATFTAGGNFQAGRAGQAGTGRGGVSGAVFIYF